MCIRDRGYLTRYVKPLLLAAAGILLLATSFWLASRFTLHTTCLLYTSFWNCGMTNGDEKVVVLA